MTVAADRLDDPELLPAADPGGMLRQVASSAAQVRSAGQPRSTLWALSVPLLVIAGQLGIADLGAGAYETAAAELERLSRACRPDSDSFLNPAKALALELAGTLPVIWGTSPLTAVAA